MCIDRRIFTGVAVSLFVFSLFTNIVSAQHRLLPIEDFEAGVRNRLGGYQQTYQRAPSSATAVRLPEAALGRGGMGLRLAAERKDSGYCGYWMHFFDMQSANRQYVDATKYRFLSFWVKGALGGESFTIKLADQDWIEKEDSVAVGVIDRYLPNGVTTRWQEVLVPLDGELGLRLDRLGGLTLDFDTPGQMTVFIDSVSLKSSRAAGVHNTEAAAPAAGKAVPLDAADARSGERALWLWSTEDMLDDPNLANQLFALCNAQGITQVWAQLLYELRPARKTDKALETQCVIRRQTAMSRFLREAHDAGVEIHALAGCPENAVRDHHHVSLAIVDAVIAFNQQHAIAEQFDGIHFDNEPYLLLGWHDPQIRQQILFEFLTLNAQCLRRTSACSPKIQFGVDIPFWWQASDPQTRKAIGDVTFHGRHQSASYHLLEMLDNVGVMNYRDQAQGSDGMVAHGRELLVRGDVAARAKLFMGVETSPPETTRVLFAVGQPRSNFELALRSGARHLAMLSRLGGHRLRVFDDDDHVHVGIEIRGDDTIENRREIAATVLKIANALGANGDATEQLDLQSDLTRALSRDKGWSNIGRCDIRDPVTGKRHLLVSGDNMVPEKITFADDGIKRFSSQVAIADQLFRQHKSYAGIAVHHYESFRRLLRGGPAVDVVGEPDAENPPAARPRGDNAVTLTSAR